MSNSNLQDGLVKIVLFPKEIQNGELTATLSITNNSPHDIHKVLVKINVINNNRILIDLVEAVRHIPAGQSHVWHINRQVAEWDSFNLQKFQCFNVNEELISHAVPNKFVVVPPPDVYEGFLSIMKDNLATFKVSDDALRGKMQAMIVEYERHVERYSEFRQAYHLPDLKAYQNHYCPHCETTLKLNENVCSSCSGKVVWAKVDIPLHAGYTQKRTGHTYVNFSAGPCKPENLELYEARLRYLKPIIELQRQWVVLRESSTTPAINTKKETRLQKSSSGCSFAVAIITSGLFLVWQLCQMALMA